MVREGGEGELRQQGGKTVNLGEKYPNPDSIDMGSGMGLGRSGWFQGSQEGEEEVAGLKSEGGGPNLEDLGEYHKDLELVTPDPEQVQEGHEESLGHPGGEGGGQEGGVRVWRQPAALTYFGKPA
jgi:hypothetical protein